MKKEYLGMRNFFLNQFYERRMQLILYILILLLLLPALLINLGLEPIIDDEGIRGLVSVEMGLRHDIISPTLGGEYYFNKPPLYNWILLGVFKLSGSASDFMLRLPTVFFIICFATTIFLITRQLYGNRFGFLNALAFITCGRLLFYDSFKGLIDTSFSWLIYMSFWVIYYYSRKDKFLSLFLLSYFIIALAFLMKGLPAILFQIMTLGAWFVAIKKIKQLFSWQHMAGILLFLLIIGSYYVMYYMAHPELIRTIAATILNESTKKTVLAAGFFKGFIHILSFPFEFMYHFFPWTIFSLYLCRNGSVRRIMEQPFLKFSVIVFLVNIMVYWVSPTTFARYLFMFLPLYFAPLIWLYLENERDNTLWNKVIRVIFIFMPIVVLLGSVLGPSLDITRHVEFSVIKGASLMVASLLLLFGIVRLQHFRMEIVILVLLITRIGFNWFIIPSRYESTSESMVSNEILKAASISRGESLFYDQKLPEFKTPVLFHLTVQRNSICLFDTTYKKNGLYLITNETKIKTMDYEKLAQIHARSSQSLYYLVRFK